MGFKVAPLRSVFLAVATGVLIFTAVLTTGASAAQLAFDPVLSLTGGCTVSSQDPIADPTCPGPPLPPSGSFNSPRAVATDSFGDIYVASYGKESGPTGDGRIDIFDPNGEFLVEIAGLMGPKSLAVDSQGFLYVYQNRSGVVSQLERYKPTVYKPAEEEIAYGNAPAVIVSGLPNFVMAISINPLNDHLFTRQGGLTEYATGAEENTLIATTAEPPGFFPQGAGLAFDATHGRLYLSSQRSSTPDDRNVIRVLELASPHAEIETIDGSDLPLEEAKFPLEPALAVDESTGHIFAYFEGGSEFDSVYELTETGAFVAQIDHEFEVAFSLGVQPTVDNGDGSPNKGYLFVPSRAPGSAVGHSYAFGPQTVCAPTVEELSFANVSESEAELSASIEPCGLATDYSFEITTKKGFEEHGFDSAAFVGSGQIPAAGTPATVSAGATGLMAGTDYRFRVTATNGEEPEAVAEGALSTYPESPLTACANDPLRTGFSGDLPDCRAYELVTPPDTNARSPIALNRNGFHFATRESSSAGNKVSFQIGGGTIPGFSGTGSLGGDPYLVTRGLVGWSTASAGPTGLEAPALVPGSTSPDQGYLFWATGSGAGSASVGGQSTNYVRYPDGHSGLVGRGSEKDDPRADGKLISEGGGHIIFVSKNHLEAAAPSGNTAAVYDRTSDEVTHVVSLLPGDETPANGETAQYLGASLDGRGIAFEIGNVLYLRYNDEATYEVGSGIVFAGVAEGGERIFFVEGGRLKALDVQSGVIPFTTLPGTVPVNVSADGSAAYFVSTSVVPKMENPLGQKPKAGQQNLYLSREGTISFVGIVTERDVAGEFINTEPLEGLGLWAEAVSKGAPGKDPSRINPSGSVLLFESRAKLTEYDSEGTVEVFRYDSEENTLWCLSCNPTGSADTGKASLMSINSSDAFGTAEPLTSSVLVNNLTADGNQAFFQSTEPLVAADTDELQDVYEWEEQGIGGCVRPGGCISLISSGQSSRIDYLYAVSDSGDDVFFRTADLLLPADQEETPSIYDARVGGGFAEQESPAPCEGEGCRSVLPSAPSLAAPAVPAVGAQDNLPGRCPKGKHRVRRHGKPSCVGKPKPHHNKHNRHSRANQIGGRK